MIIKVKIEHLGPTHKPSVRKFNQYAFSSNELRIQNFYFNGSKFVRSMRRPSAAYFLHKENMLLTMLMDRHSFNRTYRSCVVRASKRTVAVVAAEDRGDELNDSGNCRAWDKHLELKLICSVLSFSQHLMMVVGRRFD